MLYNGLGRYDEALAAAEQGSEYPDELGLATWSMVELIEAAARTGQPERATGALRRLVESTSAAGTDWALGIEARSRALLGGGELADRLYREAIQRLGRTRIRAELARAHLLYGEWLRRQNRRLDAREQLRAAYEMLTAMGIEGFAERARRELLATGETVRKRTVAAPTRSPPRRRRSPGSPATGRRTRRSARSCSSARARSSGTCARCSRNSASAPGKSSARRCPQPGGAAGAAAPLPAVANRPAVRSDGIFPNGPWCTASGTEDAGSAACPRQVRENRSHRSVLSRAEDIYLPVSKYI